MPAIGAGSSIVVLSDEAGSADPAQAGDGERYERYGLRWRRPPRRGGDVVVIALGTVLFAIAVAAVGWALLHSGR